MTGFLGGDLLRWGEWVPLREASRHPAIPATPGLYRVRRVGRTDLDYIGQTGMGSMTVRKRLAMLKGVYSEQMPYHDPHTAGPALWALRHATACDFEASAMPVAGSTAWRKGLEAVAIALYRQEHGQSPTVEFGRLPVGYTGSSSYNRRLLDAGRVYRGGLSTDADPGHLPGIPPVGPLGGDPQAGNWCGHAWEGWVPLARIAGSLPRVAVGLYRIRDAVGDGLVYIGQGAVTARLAAHGKKAGVPGERQGEAFASASRPECSWVINAGWLPHQRLELENDLVAAHLLELGRIPAAQFLG